MAMRLIGKYEGFEVWAERQNPKRTGATRLHVEVRAPRESKWALDFSMASKQTARVSFAHKGKVPAVSSESDVRLGVLRVKLGRKDL